MGKFIFLDPIDLDLDNSNISGFPGTGWVIHPLSVGSDGLEVNLFFSK